jgi:hypothetical protein
VAEVPSGLNPTLPQETAKNLTGTGFVENQLVKKVSRFEIAVRYNGINQTEQVSLDVTL